MNQKNIVMKAKFFFSILVVFCLCTVTFANTRETIKLSNVEQTENGCIKEFLQCDKITNAPISKTVYHYDVNGRMMDKAAYEWDGSKGWIGTLKYVYQYDENNLPTTPTIIKWNKKANDWFEK